VNLEKADEAQDVLARPQAGRQDALEVSGSVQSARGAAMVATFAVFTFVISIFACAVPIRRALRVEPTEALRAGI